MKLLKILTILFLAFLMSCGTTNFSLITSGTEPSDNTRFNVKLVKDGCCGCAGILVNTFRLDELQSQLYVESNESCPYNWTKLNFYYSSNGTLTRTDTLIAVSDNTFTYPITRTDKIALEKAYSFIFKQTVNYYRIRKIDITGYRDATAADNMKIYFTSAFMDKKAVR
ncbi:MAG: hypothetical protein JWQ27_3203 [Ferruginibacter sp.]|nr:hypothetical protein [Ferruginibacter sp.]